MIIDTANTYLFKSFTISKVGEILLLKYGLWMLPRRFSETFTTNIDFIAEVEVRYDDSIVKIFV